MLRAGGRLVVLETSPAPLLPMRLYLRNVLPLLGGLIAGDRHAYTYLPRSTLAFVAPERLPEVMRDYGLRLESVDRRSLGSVAVTVARKE